MYDIHEIHINKAHYPYGNVEEEIINEIIEFLIIHPKSTQSIILDNIHRKRNNVSKIFKVMLKSKMFLVEENINHPQTDVYSIDIKSVWMDNNLLTVYAFPSRINYGVIFAKWTRRKLIQRDKNSIYFTAMANIEPCLNMAKIFFWYSCDTNGKVFSTISKNKLEDMKKSIKNIIEIVDNLDKDTGNMVKNSINNHLFSLR